jgi:hypothetical protein
MNTPHNEGITMSDSVFDLATEMEHGLYQTRQLAIAISSYMCDENEPAAVIAGVIADILKSMDEKRGQIWQLTHPKAD